MSIKAMKQALEALDGINDEDCDKDFLNLKQFVRLDMAIQALRTAIQQAESEPVLFVSPEQARAVTGKNRVHYTPSDNSGRYLPVRATPAGLFTQALYTHPAPGVPDDGVRDAERWRAVENASGELTLRLHNSRCDQRAAIVDAAMTAAQAQKG